MSMQAADELQAALDKFAMANRSRRAADSAGHPMDDLPLESKLADHLAIAAALRAYRPEPSTAFLRRSQQAILGLGSRPQRGWLSEFLGGFTSAPPDRRARLRLAALPLALALMAAMVPLISLAAPGSPLYGLRQASGRALAAVQDSFGQSLAALFHWDRPPAEVGTDGAATPEPRTSKDADALLARADGSAPRPGTDPDTTAPTWGIVTKKTIAPSRRRTPTASSPVTAAQSASPTAARQSPTQGSIAPVSAITVVPAATEVPSFTAASATRQPTVTASARPTDMSGPSATTTIVPTLPPTRTPPPAGATATSTSTTTAPTPTDDPGSCPTANRRVTGRLTGPDGQPVADAQVLIADSLGENHQGSADGVGAFSINGLCPGFYQAMAFLEHPGGMLLGFYDPDGDGRPDWLDLTADSEPPGGIDILLSAVETPTPVP